MITPGYWGRLTFAVANRCIEPESPRLVPSTTFQLQHMDGSYCQSLSLLSFLDVVTVSRMRHRPQGHTTRQVVVNHHMTGWSLGSFHFQYLEACIGFTNSTAQGGGGRFKNRKPIGEVGCCESGMAERSHWWTERWLRSPLFPSLSLTIYLPTYQPIFYVSIYLSIDLSISLFLSFI